MNKAREYDRNYAAMYHKKYPTAKRAHAKVQSAKERGDLPWLGRCPPAKCVDCGDEAIHYDHRDYLKPLDVVPVCGGCNKKRGPGLNGGVA